MDFIETINKINKINGSGIEVKPVPHFKVEILSRGKGAHRSVVGYAAYCARTRLRNERDGRIYNWSKRKDLIFSKIMLPKNAPRRFFDRNVLWNEVEKVEKNKNAQLARTLVIALPTEFSADTWERVVYNFVQNTFVNRGMCADISIHDKGTGNPHAHIILTMRSLDNEGNWMAKQRKIYQLDENGKKIYDRTKKQYKCTIQKTNDWDNLCNVELWREQWANVCNKEFERLGLSKRVTHKSYRRQGVDIIPTKHLGSASTAMERKGVRTKVGEENRDIRFQNLKLIFDMICQARKMLMKQEKSKQQQIFDLDKLRLLVYNFVYNIECKIPKFPQLTQGYRQYRRKYTRTPSRSFAPSR